MQWFQASCSSVGAQTYARGKNFLGSTCTVRMPVRDEAYTSGIGFCTSLAYTFITIWVIIR